MKQKYSFLLGIVLFLSVTASLGYFFYANKSGCCASQVSLNGIYELNAARDKQFILQSFSDDWYWLIAEGSQFFPEKMVDERAYPQAGPIKGNLFIAVGYEDGRPTGFVAYYMKSLISGCLLFLDVHKDFRSKGWGRKLLDYGVKAMLAKGAQRVDLVTRVNNEPARRLYTRYGFKEIREYGPGFVDYSFYPQK